MWARHPRRRTTTGCSWAGGGEARRASVCRAGRTARRAARGVPAGTARAPAGTGRPGANDGVGADPRRAAHGGRPGPVLGRYRLTRRLGAGGFGVVYAAHDEQLDREVAVKRIVCADATAARRAEREARAAARLAHPGIVALYEAARDDEAVYLVSELVEGRSLAELEREGLLSDRDVLRAGVALCDALAHAHRRGVVHRDVKPANVLVPTPRRRAPAWRSSRTSASPRWGTTTRSPPLATWSGRSPTWPPSRRPAGRSTPAPTSTPSASSSSRRSRGSTRSGRGARPRPRGGSAHGCRRWAGCAATSRSTSARPSTPRCAPTPPSARTCGRCAARWPRPRPTSPTRRGRSPAARSRPWRRSRPPRPSRRRRRSSRGSWRPPALRASSPPSWAGRHRRPRPGRPPWPRSWRPRWRPPRCCCSPRWAGRPSRSPSRWC